MRTRAAVMVTALLAAACTANHALPTPGPSPPQTLLLLPVTLPTTTTMPATTTSTTSTTAAPLRTAATGLPGLAVPVNAYSCASTSGRLIVPNGPRIMVVGDSISQGTSGDWTWRYRLYGALAAEGLTPDMLGPSTDLYDNVAAGRHCDHTYPDPHFNQAHDASWGQTLAHAAATVNADVAAFRPDYLAVLLGDVDLFAGASPAELETTLETFIGAARAANPHVRFLLCPLPPVDDARITAAIGVYNALLPGTASRLSSADSPIVVAPDPGIDVSSDLWDGTDPNALGEAKIAAAFASALARLGVGRPMRWEGTLPTGPPFSPRLSVAAGKGTLTLTWLASPGATAYQVWVDDADRTAAFSPLPIPIFAPAARWTGSFPPGDRYVVKIRAFKGEEPGAFSNEVGVTVGR